MTWKTSSAAPSGSAMKPSFASVDQLPISASKGASNGSRLVMAVRPADHAELIAQTSEEGPTLWLRLRRRLAPGARAREPCEGSPRPPPPELLHVRASVFVNAVEIRASGDQDQSGPP